MRERWKELWKESERVREIVGSNGIKLLFFKHGSRQLLQFSVVLRRHRDWNSESLFCRKDRSAPGNWKVRFSWMVCWLILQNFEENTVLARTGPSQRAFVVISLQSSVIAASVRCQEIVIVQWRPSDRWFNFTRLETRAKESNAIVSLWVQTSKRRETKNVRRSWELYDRRRLILCEVPSKNTCAGTRKMVNYACAG